MENSTNFKQTLNTDRPALSQKMQQQFNERFIYECNNFIKKYTKALSRCQPSIDPSIPAILKQAIAALENTVRDIQNGTKKMEDLKRFKIQVAIPLSVEPQPIKILCRLDQSHISKSLPVNSYLEVIPPVGEKYKAPLIIEKNCLYNYTNEFKLGAKTSQNFALLKASDFLFNIYYIPPSISTPVPELIGSASFGLGPLQFTSSISQTLEFIDENGVDSGIKFECRLSMDGPLAPDEGINIDDIIRVFSV